MRHGSSNRRQRGRGNGNGGRRGNQQRSKVYDSNGPDVRIRGTAHQVAEKYETLAKDSMSSGDRVMAESYLQHAEHYLRIISSFESSDSDDKSSAPKASKASSKDKVAEDDLGLPASILGEGSKEKSQAKSEELSAS